MERLPAARSYWSRKRNYIKFGWLNITLALKHLKGSCFSKLTMDAILKFWDHSEVPLYKQAKYDIETPLLAYRNIADPSIISSWTICPVCKDKENNPFHFYFECPVLVSFWKKVRPIIVLLTLNATGKMINDDQPSISDLLSVGTSLLVEFGYTNTVKNQPLVAFISSCFFSINQTWSEAFKENTVFNSIEIMNKLNYNFDQYLLVMLNACVLPWIKVINKDFGFLKTAPGEDQNTHSCLQGSRLITCPSALGRNFPFLIKPIYNLPSLSNEEGSFPAPTLGEIKPFSVNCRPIIDLKSHFNKRFEKGLRKSPVFLSLIKPFIDISYPEPSKAVLLRKNLDNILKEPIQSENLQEPTLTNHPPSLSPFLMSHSNDDYGLIDPDRKSCPASQQIETPCCLMKNCMVIHCYTDGGCVNQGQVNATAAFSFAFPHFPSFVQTEVIPIWRVRTSSRAEMEAFIGCIEASICIIESHGITNPLIDICSDSLGLIKTATSWVHGWKVKNWKMRKNKKCINIDLLEKIWRLSSKYHIAWRHVRSHQEKPFIKFSDEYWNDLVDSRINKVLKGIPLHQ